MDVNKVDQRKQNTACHSPADGGSASLGFRTFRNNPLPLRRPGRGGGAVMGGLCRRAGSPPAVGRVGSRPRAVAPQTRTASHLHPGLSPGAEHQSPDAKLQVPRRRASLKGSPPAHLFLQNHPKFHPTLQVRGPRPPAISPRRRSSGQEERASR